MKRETNERMFGRWMLNIEGWVLFLFFLGQSSLLAIEPWQVAVAKMPLRTNVTELTKTNCVSLMLNAFQQDDVVKGLVFMPGSTDELYFFNRVYAQIDKPSPTLLDAIAALTNQTTLYATFRPPFLLIHSAEDPLQPAYKIQDQATAERIRKKKFLKHALFFDRDWDSLLPDFTFHTATKCYPEALSHESWHFYRHSFAGWNLTAWEALEAASLAGKTIFTIEKRKIVFEGDKRFRARPAVPASLP
jgi:hypothetical protein